MENGFSSLSSLDFVPSKTNESHSSSSLMAVLSQNEELMARIKVLATRLSSQEEENKILQDQNNKIKKTLQTLEDHLCIWKEKEKHWQTKESQHSKMNQENEELQRSFNVLSDQILIWKEKEKLWIERSSAIEKRYKTIEEQIPHFQKLQMQAERSKKFQDKIKNQVKPYVKNLKMYAQALLAEVEQQKKLIEEKDFQLLNLQTENLALAEKISQAQAQNDSIINSALENIEKERTFLEKEIVSLRESNQSLRSKAVLLDRSLEKQDELENEVIAQRRQFDENLKKYREELDFIKKRHSEERQELASKRLELESVQNNLLSESSAKLELEAKNQAIEEQLSSLRFMWQDRCNENEKLKQSLKALESLNEEMSRKLNEFLLKARQS